jgi:hypothetical protein
MPPSDSSLQTGPPSDPEQAPPRRVHWWMIESACAAVLLVVIGLAFWTSRPDQSEYANQQTPAPSASAAPSADKALSLVAGKVYGNKYAAGLLPVGDNRYSTTEAQKGSVFLCRTNFVPAGQAGAQQRGPWFVNNNTQWDVNKKAKVAGSVSWTPQMTVKLEDGKRIITTNSLPDHRTGVFPVGSTDPARVYDANPNTIKAQALTYSLDASPAYGQPRCIGGEVGVMLTGVALYNGFDAGGRDAGAWEVQDGCDGHPQNKGAYHYHTLSRCITTADVKTVIGYALDGFPITGPKVSEGNYLTTADLDECHGLTSELTIDGKTVSTYHYVLTQDFPYSVSCFRGTPVQAPGLPEGPGSGQ